MLKGLQANEFTNMSGLAVFSVCVCLEEPQRILLYKKPCKCNRMEYCKSDTAGERLPINPAHSSMSSIIHKHLCPINS